MGFYYYSQLKLRRLSLDPTKDHIVKVNDYEMFIIPTDKGISAELAMFNSHEPLTTKVIASQLNKGMVCLDIGSNIGYYAILESRIVGQEGKVICIEPSALNFQYLRKNLEMEGKSNIQTYNVAVGDIDESVYLVADNRSNLCRVVKQSELNPIANGYNEDKHLGVRTLSKIPMKRIDSLIGELAIDRLDLVRMDPEGYESNIYRGMKSTIQKYKPMLFIEFHRIYLGIEGTRTLLQDLKNDGYESLYYIQRWMDHPIISSAKYIQKMQICELFKKLDKDTVPGVFSLFLVNKRK
jgi:FkbM family methyltransferase